MIFDRKIHGSMFGSGLPDYLLIVNGVVHFWEFKRVGGILSGQQKSVLSLIKQAGGNVYAIVATNRNSMNVLEPPNFKVKMVLKKVNSQWEGLRELLGLSTKMDIEI